MGDYPQGHMIRRLGLVEQPVPDVFRSRSGESVQDYHDRTYRGYFFPATLAPLNLPKSAFVEIANPLLSRRVLEISLRLPDILRRERFGFKRVVQEHGPDIPFATAHAPAEPHQYLSRDDLREAFRRELESSTAANILPPEALPGLASTLAEDAVLDARQSGRARLKAMLPERAYALLRSHARLALSPRRLGFRAAVASRASSILSEDAGALAELKTADRRR
jgi:hypothetical protein